MEKDRRTKGLEWCPEADLNHRHADFQSAALPTELSGHFRLLKNLRFRDLKQLAAPKVSGVITSCSNMASTPSNFFDSFFIQPVDDPNIRPGEPAHG